MFAYRPPNRIVQILHDFFNASPASTVPSNFPACAQRLADLQAEEETDEYSSYDVRTGHTVHANAPLQMHGTVTQSSMEAPQERDLDARIMARKVERALMQLSPQHRAVLDSAYDQSEADPKLTQALTPLLVGLAPFSQFEPEKHVDDPYIMAAIRVELDDLWRSVHCAFENEFKNI